MDQKCNSKKSHKATEGNINIDFYYLILRISMYNINGSFCKGHDYF